MLSKQGWVGVLGRMQHVAHLRVSARSATQLPEVLRSRVDRSGEGNEAFLLPNLRVLQLDQVVFTEESTFDEHQIGDITKALVGSLEERRTSRVPLKTLVLANCINLGKADFDQFQMIVQEVQWGAIVNT
ncbi:hypothetical protein WOLCODRAFT_140282 [Wolfiporia cocos MD-104 SS10]|uniref:Uncharacterized protein n=1 Tax=Wolfiporia cocos (strain MD-104) TaxID=742152 RepID=A0A2H3J8V4_WOLCO|nr:hypothetical protein WOLCODRAFT_140282 [Wolfiporia cocos MD-104 SS10]